jgi:metal transporter CNNM
LIIIFLGPTAHKAVLAKTALRLLGLTSTYAAGEPIGIITIEDVLEELMGQEILDETDRFADNTRTVEVNEDTRWVDMMTAHSVKLVLHLHPLPAIVA